LGIFLFVRGIPKEYQVYFLLGVKGLKRVFIAALCFMALPLTGPSGRYIPRVSPISSKSSSPTSLRDQLAITAALFRAERYEEAQRQSQELKAAAMRSGDMRTATRATGNLGAMQFALHQNRNARTALLEARGMAVAMGDASETAAIDANLCSLYMDMGEFEEAGRRMQGTLERLSGRDRVEHLAETQVVLATLRARENRMAEALPLFRAGIADAESKGNWKLAAFTWNRIGEEYLQQDDWRREARAKGAYTSPAAEAAAKQRDLRLAEPALLEAFRIRVLHNLPLNASYRNLGRLRLEQGNLDAAEEFLNRAVELTSQPQGPIPSWDIYHYRGRVRLAQGRLAEAMSDLRTAVRLTHAWRWSAPPDDAIRIRVDEWLDRVYSAFIDCGNRLYQQTGDPALMRETFEAAEQNRASSLRLLIQGRSAAAESLPLPYWPAVTRLQRAEVDAVRLHTPAAEQDALSARASLSEIEAAAFGAPPSASAGLLARTQEQLAPSDALLAFHLGDLGSWMWAVTRDRIDLYLLPAREEIGALARSFSDSVSGGAPEMKSAGTALYAALFGRLAPEFQDKRRWLLALDDALFDVPFAALPAGGEGLMAQRRITEIVPGAALWSHRLAPPKPGLFLGIGDAIYNPADPRRTEQEPPAPQPASSLKLVSLAILPRLPASASELDISARAWIGGNHLLKGRDASRESLAEGLARNPRVIHFATHFVESAGADRHGAIVLSLNRDGQAETLHPPEIVSWRVNADLVALSGCHSSAGAVHPGSGLLGLTRAWLGAGARGVLATHWEVPDDGGPLFAAFYRHLGELGETPAEALRAAQVEMAASGGWRSNPRYWAAYFVTGKE
jgi:CHAT domain-containing protein